MWNSLDDSHLDLSILSSEDLKIDSSMNTPPKTQIPRVAVDYCQSVKLLAVLGLVAAYIISFVLIGIGVALVHELNPHPSPWLRGTILRIGLRTRSFYKPSTKYTPGHFAIPVSKTGQVVIPLFLNYGLTAVLDALFVIHSTTQRWSTWEEHKLKFHSNPRLFTASKTYLPNQWSINLLSGTTLVFAYGALGTLTANIDIGGYGDGHYGVSDIPYTGSYYGLDFSGCSMLVLGMCLLTQAFISTCCVLYRPQLVRTWSQSALMTARAVIYHQFERPTQDVHDPINTTYCQASLIAELPRPDRARIAPQFTFSHPSGRRAKRNTKPEQIHGPTKALPSARETVPTIRRITTIMWLFAATLAGVTAAIAIVGKYRNYESADYVLSWTIDTTDLSLSSYWAWYGAVYFRYSDFHARSILDMKNFDGLTILLQSLFQMPLTFVLYYVGLLFNVIRDELNWREASSKKGATVSPRAFVPAWRNWPTLALYLYKGLTQWIFGSMFRLDSVLLISLIPMATLALLMLVLAAFAEVMSRWRPEGEQPVTFGSLALLERYMDDLESDVIFWKGGPRGGKVLSF
jgi:hypothetical protein